MLDNKEKDKTTIYEINQSAGGTFLSPQLLVRIVVLMNTKFILFSIFLFFFLLFSTVLTDESTLSSIFALSSLL